MATFWIKCPNADCTKMLKLPSDPAPRVGDRGTCTRCLHTWDVEAEDPLTLKDLGLE